MAEIFDLARMSTATVGAGTITLGAAISGYLSFAGAGVPDGAKVVYGIKDGANSEAGYGTYTAAGTTLSRDKILVSTNGGAAIVLSGAAEVYVAFAAESLPQPSTSGMLAIASATQLLFSPYNGDRIKIAGLWYKIPSAGITGNNTGIFINGTGGLNLAASTTYYVYLFNNAGTLTFDFSTTAHATDATSGNVGTEIKSGDTTRSLIGMIHTNGSAQFVDDFGNGRLVLSWFNRQNKTAAGAGSGSATTVLGADFLITSTIDMLNWAGEAVNALWNVQALVTGSNFTHTEVAYDNVANVVGGAQYIYAIANPVPAAIGGWAAPSEGSHTYGGYGAGNSQAAGGTLSLFNGTISLMTRG